MHMNDKEKVEKLKWFVVFTIWLIGALALLGLWEWQGEFRGSAGDTLAFILQLTTWAYPFALLPITWWVSGKIEKM